MKNVIPLVVAVVLGLAAVYAVSKMMAVQNAQVDEEMVDVVVAAGDLQANTELGQGELTHREVPASALPRNAIQWSNVNMLYGQTIRMPIAQNDYVLLENVSGRTPLGACTTRGEWTIPVTFSDPQLIKMLSANDEIAIIASRTVAPSASDDAVDPSELPAGGSQRETFVVLPCVSIVGFVCGPNGYFRDPPAGESSSVLVSLPPRQAMMLLAAQREFELYPVLRTRNDTTATNRVDLGVVDATTFESMRKGLVPLSSQTAPAKPEK
ncbi:MAG: SAF domain-containing protein [Victivallaceae bacterium]|nr:SAF domain-containing protein [Victivallaceae bacterium]